MSSCHRKCFPQQRNLEVQHQLDHDTEAGDGVDVLDLLEGHHIQAGLHQDHDQHRHGAALV